MSPPITSVSAATRPAAAPSAPNAASGARLKKQCTEFEALMARQMLAAARSASGNLGAEPSNARQTFDELYEGEVAKKMAEQGALGVGDQLYHQLLPQIQPQPRSPE